ncbi:hypothetical protein [uncultured Thermanaerothrix sp.]|uniref:hypothetical protein n=1 Tax=uncultured Thermanaerothrix sp. TaxID=1195149 RepID=UPI00260D87C7|nr:hypothetical protein [uncultured Thermanaerothrix sp.]
MKMGMLWYDDDPKADLRTKVHRAAEYYQKKYGVRPNLCYVHPSMLAQERMQFNEIEIRTNRRVLRNHLWLGLLELGDPAPTF